MKIFGGNFGKFALVLVTALFVCGCGKGTAPEGSRDYIYYVNSDGTGLVKEDYEISGEGVKEQVDEVLGELRKKTDSLDFKSAYPENVRIRGWKLEESELILRNHITRWIPVKSCSFGLPRFIRLCRSEA